MATIPPYEGPTQPMPWKDLTSIVATSTLEHASIRAEAYLSQLGLENYDRRGQNHEARVDRRAKYLPLITNLASAFSINHISAVDIIEDTPLEDSTPISAALANLRTTIVSKYVHAINYESVVDKEPRLESKRGSTIEAPVQNILNNAYDEIMGLVSAPNENYDLAQPISVKNLPRVWTVDLDARYDLLVTVSFMNRTLYALQKVLGTGGKGVFISLTNFGEALETTFQSPAPPLTLSDQEKRAEEINERMMEHQKYFGLTGTDEDLVTSSPIPATTKGGRRYRYFLKGQAKHQPEDRPIDNFE